MPVVSTSLRWGEKAFTALGVVFALAALWMWLQAILAWGDAYALSQALAWTVLTLAVFAPAFVIEYIRNRGD